MSIFTKKKTIVAHNGSFHADDIFACATLLILLENKAKIIRTRDKNIIDSADYVVDVGGEHNPEKNHFDHHQIGGAGLRPNSIPYASFGLVWKKFGEQLCGSKTVADKIDEKLVQSIDAGDNGINLFDLRIHLPPYLIQSAFYAFRPSWKEGEDYDKPFMEVVKFAQEILMREISRMIDAVQGEALVNKIYRETTDKKILVLDGKYPWEEIAINYPETLFVVAPRPDGNWKVEGVRVKLGSFECRKYLPHAWAGMRDEDMAKASGVPDAIFCHNGLFMAVTNSRAGAIALAQKAI